MIGGPSAALDQRREELRRRKRLPDPVRRQEATRATVAKYRDLPFDWRTGRHCVRMAAYHMRQMGWRSPELPTIPRVRSAIGAKKALKERGFKSVTQWLDSILERVSPAEMLVGDIAVVEGEAGLDALFLCVGPRRLFGWREDEPVSVVLEVGLDEVAGAWRV